MFLLGKERAKDEFDLLLASGMSFSEARAALREKERSRKESSLTKKCDEYAAQFHTSSAGITKEAMTLSNKGAPLAISSIKSLSAISLQRLPEARQPLSLANRVLTDVELVEVAVRRAYTSGSMDLKNCSLSTLPPKAMNTLLVQFGCLTSVNLNSNMLTTLPHSFAPLCPGLTELFISSNRLRDVPRAILQLPKVTELNLSFNRIAEVDVLQAPEMEVLRLSNNYVSSLDNMSYLRKLRSLHLDYCHMSELTAHMKKLKHLTFLDLSHNTLVSVALPSREAAASKAAKSGAAAKTVQSEVAAVGDTREWEEVLDPFTGRTSYFCKQTKEVRRSKPAGYDAQLEKKKAKEKIQREAVLAGALKLASIASARGDEFVPERVRTAQANGKHALQATTSKSTLLQVPEPIGDPWQELLDEDSGFPYFYNVITGETSWEKPAEDEVKMKGWELVVDTTSSDGAVYYRNLATNITQWQMPEEMDTFDALESLTELNISHNRLTQIASSVFKLPLLTELNAEHNLISSLPDTVKFATSLTKLNLSWNSLELLPREFYFMHWLVRCTVDNNRLKELSEDIGIMQGLRIFWFGMNQIERLPFAFGKLRKIEEVMFLANPYVFPAVSEFSKGKEHIMWLCRQEGHKYFKGPPPVPRLLQYGIAEEGCLYESEFLKNLTTKMKEAATTKLLNLNFNNMPKIPRETWEPLWGLTDLQDLRLVDNGFTKLTPKFLKFTCLTNLVLRRNKLVELPDHMHLWPHLRGLHVEGNVLTALPSTFFHLTNLTELTLSANRLTELPDCICTMTKLVRLCADINFFKRIPKDIGKLCQLKYLSLSRNQITTIPESIVQLTRLKKLVMYQNKLGDRGIPDCICDMSCLKVLQLSYNGISRLPYRFTSAPIMIGLRKLLLYGNCFFDVGDLPLRLKSIREFRIDNCPLKSPPARYTAGQIPALMEYTTLRISRMREIQRRCEAEGWDVDATRLVPTVAREGHFIVGGYGTLNDQELTAFDEFLEEYINGDIYACTRNPKDLIDAMVEIHRTRWFKYVRKVVMDFQEFVQFLFLQNLISDEYIATNITRPWGRDGEDIECYGIDLDALYVNTGFRVAILDVFRGPARLKVPSVCRFAGPEEFAPKDKKRNWLGFMSRKKSKRVEEDGVSSAAAPLPNSADGEEGESYAQRVEANPSGNWLWQLATEVVPMVSDHTDILNDELPPAYNRNRNPKCHPVVSHEATANQQAIDALTGGRDAASDAQAAEDRAVELTETNQRRLKVGLPPLVDPNSTAERAKRLASRRGAVHLNCNFKFYVPRHELEMILREYQGPFGPVAEPDQKVEFPDCPHPKYEAYYAGEPVPDFINPQDPVEGDAAKKKGKKSSRKKKKKKNRRPGEAHDYSDSEEEEERIALFWEGKHRPCERTAWVVAKWTLTKKEARREEAEQAEVYELAMRLREMIDEYLHTDEGQTNLNAEVERRIAKAKADLEMHTKRMSEMQNIIIEVRKQQLDLAERARRFRAGWDFEEHRFLSEHEIDKATRRAQQEMNDWEAFGATQVQRVQRRKDRVAKTRAQWEMNAVASMQRLQDKKAKEMIYEKNRRIAFKMGWRRLWDGRGGALYAKWKLKKEMELLYQRQKETMASIGTPSASEEDSDDNDTSEAGLAAKAARALKRKAATKAYDIPAAYSDPRQRNFGFSPDTGSENDQDELEKENMELSSESEFVPSDQEIAAAGGAGASDEDESGGSHEGSEEDAEDEEEQ